MRFPQEFIERVQQANNLVDLISQHTQLRPVGNGLMGRCPFPDHQEKTASFSVSEIKQVYHCFGCKKQGNIFTFLQHYNGMSFPEAIEYLADRAGMALPVEENPREAAEYDQAKEKKRLLGKVNNIAAVYFHEQLKKVSSEHPVRKYIQKRGLTAEVVETFGIGYALPDWEGLENHLQQKNVPMSLAEEARLVVARKGKPGYFDMFRDRLMFPILNAMGEPVAFGGRIIDQGEPKYLNSPETPVFKKGQILYGLYQTAKYIRTEDVALIVEGYMDLVSLYQSGIRNVVATMGTALTPDHGKMLKRMTRNVVALFDGDSAGMEAAERSLPILLAADLHPKGLTLPDGLDPDDYVKKYGAEALKAELEKAPDLFVMILTRWLENYRAEPSQKVQLADRLKPLFGAVPDTRLRDIYVNEAATRLQVSDSWLREATGLPLKSNTYQKTGARPVSNNQHSNSSSRGGMAGASAVGRNPASPNSGADVSTSSASSGLNEGEKISLKSVPKAELLMANLVLKSRANFAAFLEEKMLDSVSHVGLKKILEKAAEVYGQDLDKFDKLTSLFVNYVDQPELLFMEESAAGASAPVEFDQEKEDKLLHDCFKKVRDNFLKEQARSLANGLKSSGLSPEKLEQIMQIQRNRHSLKNNGNQ